MSGHYDLRNVSAAHDFARLIHSLRAQAQRISESMRRPSIRKFCWCLDHISLRRVNPCKASIIKVAHWLIDLPIKHRRSRWVRVLTQYHGYCSNQKYRSSSCPAVCWHPVDVVGVKSHRSNGDAVMHSSIFDEDELDAVKSVP